MKKIALSLVALAALSTASFAAGNRSWDPQDSEYLATNPQSRHSGSFGVNAGSPLAIEPAAGEFGGAISNFERLNLNSQKNESSDH
jgi:hypothetical protein